MPRSNTGLLFVLTLLLVGVLAFSFADGAEPELWEGGRPVGYGPGFIECSAWVREIALVDPTDGFTYVLLEHDKISSVREAWLRAEQFVENAVLLGGDSIVPPGNYFGSFVSARVDNVGTYFRVMIIVNFAPPYELCVITAFPVEGGEA